MKILLTGKNGQVGWELERSLQALGQVFAFDHAGLDLANPDSIRTVIRDVKPDLIVNPAAYTAVDKAESEPDLAMAVNGVAPGIIAEEAKRLDAALIHYSTDYVFDGTKPEPYTEDDAPNPINVYGKTKLAGERAIQAVGVPHLIFRTSWVYGMRGKNFLLTILRLAKERDELKIIDDQIGAPTWCRNIADATANVLTHATAKGNTKWKEGPAADGGIYNMTASGDTSWFGFASAAIKLAHRHAPLRVKLVPIPSEAYPAAARRPKNSRLAGGALMARFCTALPNWRGGMALSLAEYPGC